MLEQYVTALPGVLAPVLLTMTLSIVLSVGEGKEVPRSKNWRLCGVLIGIIAGVAFAFIRNSGILSQRTVVNIPTLFACVIFDVLLLIAVINSRRITAEWKAKSGRLNIVNFIAAVALALVYFRAVPDIVIQLLNFVGVSDSFFTSDMLLRILGFVLGIVTAIVIGWILSTMRTSVTPLVFRVTAIVLIILIGIQHYMSLIDVLQGVRIITLDAWLFNLLTVYLNHSMMMILAQVFIFAIPVALSIKAGFTMKAAPDANNAELRIARKFRSRAYTTVAWSLVAILGVTVALTYGVAQTNKTVELSAPESYSLTSTEAVVKYSQVADGHLHRFEYKAADGTTMRFIIIKKNGGAYGVGLDACENCGDAGYYEKDGKIVCKKCDVAINLATIGFKGGCNPVPVSYTAGNGKITIKTADLDALSSYFNIGA